MESRAKVAGHPLHQMLIVFPLGLLATAVVFDVIFLVTNDPTWAQASFYMIGAGVIAGLVAAIPGTIDWLAIPRSTRAKRIGLIHGVGNVVVVALFALSWFLRRDNPTLPPTEAVVAGLIGAGISVVTGWLGGELVDRLGVGVDDGAHLDAPSSLTSQSATGTSGSASRSGTGSSWSGRERRHFPQPAYAGVDRRRHA
ncbi:MAG TPA: DUF2231 domain-containing protein [Gemmatimonadales bacterium]|nr:DUF2231 domain-containing protein [Gemmatimonadales bacterium]